jgi:N-acetylglutamate synthase-like GNAT family acetyltransferase
MTTATTYQENMPKKELNIETLQFARLRIPRLIMPELIESVRGCEFTPEQFYEFHESQADNPYNYLYAVIDEDKKIHGFLWAHTNRLDNSIYINCYSISKDYWGKGKAIEKAKEILRELVRKTKPHKIYWSTTNDKFFSKHGFRRSKNVLMEYNIDKEGDGTDG